MLIMLNMTKRVLKTRTYTKFLTYSRTEVHEIALQKSESKLFGTNEENE